MRRGWVRSRFRPRLGRRGVVAVVIVMLGVVGAGAWLFARGGSAAATSRTFTSTVSAGTFQQTVSATGTLAPAEEADLDFGVSGRVTRVAVKAGQKVTIGQKLATLDRTSLDAALTSAQAQLTAAQAQYTDDVDTSAGSTQLASDSASVAAAQSGLSQARDDLDAATLTSTMDGTVASVGIAVGDQVSGSAGAASSSGSGSGASAGGSGGSSAQSATGSAGSSSTGSTAVVVVSPRLFQVAADVSADDITSVKKGMQAQVTPSGATTPVYGTVTDVGLVAQTNSAGAATFPVTVTLTGPQSKLYAGTSATVSIITKQVSNVLTVPTMALHTSGSTTYVNALVGGKKVRRTVTLGQTYGASTEVTHGLASGDKVVVTTITLPAGAGTGTRSGTRRGFGGFGGSGGPPGGFPGGGTGGGFGGFGGGQ